MAFPMHRLLELGTPSAHVAVPGPVEPAIVSYYLELIGIGAVDGDHDPVAGADADQLQVVGDDRGLDRPGHRPVSYTHLTLPTKA